MEYVRDADGALIGEVHTREAQYTRRDVDLLLAHLQIEADKGPHGQPLSEATSEWADPSRWDAKWGYEATGPFTDFAEKKIALRREAYRKSLPDGTEMPPWLKFGVRRVER